MSMPYGWQEDWENWNNRPRLGQSNSELMALLEELGLGGSALGGAIPPAPGGYQNPGPTGPPQGLFQGPPEPLNLPPGDGGQFNDPGMQPSRFGQQSSPAQGTPMIEALTKLFSQQQSRQGEFAPQDFSGGASQFLSPPPPPEQQSRLSGYFQKRAQEEQSRLGNTFDLFSGQRSPTDTGPTSPQRPDRPAPTNAFAKWWQDQQDMMANTGDMIHGRTPMQMGGGSADHRRQPIAQGYSGGAAGIASTLGPATGTRGGGPAPKAGNSALSGLGANIAQGVGSLFGGGGGARSAPQQPMGPGSLAPPLAPSLAQGPIGGGNRGPSGGINLGRSLGQAPAPNRAAQRAVAPGMIQGIQGLFGRGKNANSWAKLQEQARNGQLGSSNPAGIYSATGGRGLGTATQPRNQVGPSMPPLPEPERFSFGQQAPSLQQFLNQMGDGTSLFADQFSGIANRRSDLDRRREEAIGAIQGSTKDLRGDLGESRSTLDSRYSEGIEAAAAASAGAQENLARLNQKSRQGVSQFAKNVGAEDAVDQAQSLTNQEFDLGQMAKRSQAADTEQRSRQLTAYEGSTRNIDAAGMRGNELQAASNRDFDSHLAALLDQETQLRAQAQQQAQQMAMQQYQASLGQYNTDRSFAYNDWLQQQNWARGDAQNQIDFENQLRMMQMQGGNQGPASDEDAIIEQLMGYGVSQGKAQEWLQRGVRDAQGLNSGALNFGQHFGGSGPANAALFNYFKSIGLLGVPQEPRQ